MSLSWCTFTHTNRLLTRKWTALVIRWSVVICTLISSLCQWILVPITKGIEGTDYRFQDTIGHIWVITVGAPSVDCTLFRFVTFPITLEPNMTMKKQIKVNQEVTLLFYWLQARDWLSFIFSHALTQIHDIRVKKKSICCLTVGRSV